MITSWHRGIHIVTYYAFNRNASNEVIDLEYGNIWMSFSESSISFVWNRVICETSIDSFSPIASIYVLRSPIPC